MYPIRIPPLSPLVVSVLISVVMGCAHRAPEATAAVASTCEGTPLIVHNNSGGNVEVYEYLGGAKMLLATLSPGTHQVTLTSVDPRLSYGAQAVGRREVLTATSATRANDRVRLERTCA